MTVYYNKDRKKWLYNFQHDGKRYSGNCRDELGNPATSRSAARMAEEVERRRVKTTGAHAQPGEVSFAQIVNELLPAWKEQTDWPNKQRYLREVIDYFGAETPIASIDEAKVQDLPMHLL